MTHNKCSAIQDQLLTKGRRLGYIHCFPNWILVMAMFLNTNALNVGHRNHDCLCKANLQRRRPSAATIKEVARPSAVRTLLWFPLYWLSLR